MAIRFEGNGVWNAFKNEPGKHVVQRIPPTETKGRRQTSTISVAVLPLFNYEHNSLPDSEIEIQTQRGSGPGGQHRNTTDSAVRAIHRPTGLQVYIDGRKQSQNKKEAIRILTAKVNQQNEEKKLGDLNQQRQQQMGGGSRAGKIRTYNFLNGRVTDHRLNKKSNQIDQIMRGRFDLIIK